MSDSYDPEFGTSDNADALRGALKGMYDRVSFVLSGQPPIYALDILKLPDGHSACQPAPKTYTATLTEREWRLLRFALERAQETI